MSYPTAPKPWEKNEKFGEIPESNIAGSFPLTPQTHYKISLQFQKIVVYCSNVLFTINLNDAHEKT
jgi:hypothetical protein